MKKIFLLTLLAIGFQSKAQLFMTTNGEVSIVSKTPMENIDAVNKSVSSIINTATNEVAVQMRITNFVFPNKLMQEHFNENYMESERFPTTKFAGKIKEEVDLSKPGTYPVTAEGNLTIHGVTKPVQVKGTIVATATALQVNFSFQVRTADYQIEVPTLVFDKIAETIAISGKLNLLKQ